MCMRLQGLRFTLARRFTFAWQRTPSGAEATSSADQNGHLVRRGWIGWIHPWSSRPKS
ncbi:hypothetical protein T02_6134 [Trichinella nativa]|uniref:Uncharacterized protein n=1 Tax=Trichinella nativa TaxID=6335 RepID=A0A0V1KHU9_9BILA|nr:hypothetical protein T02_6134 [Trichinella nativa]